MNYDRTDEDVEDSTSKEAEEEGTIAVCRRGDLIFEETNSGTENADIGTDDRAMNTNGEEL